jgi:hypothetical protein
MSNHTPASTQLHHPESAQPRATTDRRLHLVVAFVAAIVAVLSLAAVNSASVGANTGDAPADTSSGESANAGHRLALGQVDAQTIASLDHHAPALTDSVWCAAMSDHHGDWDGLSEQVSAAADKWATTTDGMFEFVGVVVQTVCPETAAAFLDSTR